MSTSMLASSAFQRALRNAAPNLTKRFFSCQARTFHDLPIQSLKNRRVSLRGFRDAQSRVRPQHVPLCRGFRTTAKLTEAIKNAEQAIQQSSRFPDTSSNAVAYWLLASAASVFGIVVFGGLTRLTESGYVLPSVQRFEFS